VEQFKDKNYRVNDEVNLLFLALGIGNAWSIKNNNNKQPNRYHKNVAFLVTSAPNDWEVLRAHMMVKPALV